MKKKLTGFYTKKFFGFNRLSGNEAIPAKA